MLDKNQYYTSLLLLLITGGGLSLERTVDSGRDLPNNPSSYLVSSQGRDSLECLSYIQSNVSCRTVTYILQNQCEEDQLLYIRLNGNDVHKEPCWENMEDTFIKNYRCYVNLFGDSEKLSQLKCEYNIALASKERTNVFSLLLTLSESTLQHCSISNINLNYAACNRTKLRLSNLFLSDFQIISEGEHVISANSVTFYKSSVTIEAKSQGDCVFSCRNCTFVSNGAAAITFTECSRAILTVQDSVFLSAQLSISFLFNTDFIVENVTMTSVSDQEQGSQIIIQQIDSLNSKVRFVSNIFLKGIEVLDNFPSLDSNDESFTIKIDLFNSMNSYSIVKIEDSSSVKSSSLLDLAVAKRTSPSSLLQEEHVHKVSLDRVLTEGNSGSDILRIKSGVNVFVEIIYCTFIENQVEEPSTGTSAVSIETTEGSVAITNSQFVGNSGLLGSAVKISRANFQMLKANISHCNFINNTAAKLGGALLIQANFVDLMIEDCRLKGNKAGDVGGALLVKPFQAGDDTTDEIMAEYKIIISCSTFRDNVASFYGGAIMLNRMKGELQFNLESVIFENNGVNKAGGGAVASLGTARTHSVFTNSMFLYNSATVRVSSSYLFGGSVLLTNQSIEMLIVTNCIISHNTVINGHLMGGMVTITQSIINTFILDNVTMSHNTGSGLHSGGAVLDIRTVSGTSPNISLSIVNCVAFENTGQLNPGFFILDTSYSSSPGIVSVSITDSVFTKNIVSGHLVEPGTIHITVTNLLNAESKNILTITNSRFSLNKGSLGSAVCLHLKDADASVSINNSQFTNNVAGLVGGAVRFQLGLKYESVFSVRLKNVDFIQNALLSGKYERSAGAALTIASDNPEGRTVASRYKVTALLQDVKCLNNTSEGYGGALAFYLSSSSLISIVDSDFRNNEAGRTFDGGALYFYIQPNLNPAPVIFQHPKLFIRKSSFINNIAGQGGSLFQKSFQNTNGTLTIKETSFFCCNGTFSKTHAYNSTILVADFATHIENVRFHDKPQNPLSAIPGLNLKSKDSASHSLNSLFYECDKARNILNTGFLNTDESLELSSDNQTIDDENDRSEVDSSLTTLSLTCARCTHLPYTAGDGIMHIFNTAPKIGQHHLHFSCSEGSLEDSLCHVHDHYFETKVPCRACPFGGDCSKIAIVARPNYWGYTKDDLIVFQTCPQGYCCNGIDVPCESYDTCALNRRGRLCGECEHGYSESLMSKTCIPDEQCDDVWMWPVAILLAFSYLLWYMYKEEIMSGFTTLLIQMYKCKCFRKGISPQSDNGAIATEESRTVSESLPDNAYFDILVYFVNILGLLKVKVEFQKSENDSGILYYVEKYLTKYLDMDVQQVADITLCPFPGTGATAKFLARPVFVLMMLLTWIFINLMTYIVTMILEKKGLDSMSKLKCFRLKLIEGYIETIKYSYSGLAGATFIFLTCISINGEKFWLYNAEIKCFSGLQFFVILFACTFTFPFSLATIWGCRLLEHSKIGHVQFMLACSFPLPFLIYWFGAFFIFDTSSSCKTMRSPCFAKSNVAEQNFIVNEKSQVILDAYEGPYRDKHTSWEGVIEFRKLLFNAYYLISNNIYRLVFCTITAVVTLIHHNSIKPFKSKSSNKAETLSLGLLCIACVTNSVKTVFTELGILVESNTPTEQLLYLMNRLDRILIIILLIYIAFSKFYFNIKKLKKKK